jgi:hypothetical protein
VRADILLEQGPHTSGRRRLTIAARRDPDRLHGALAELAASWQAEFPGVAIAPRADREREDVGEWEVVIPAGLDGGHEAHFALVLDTFLRAIDEGRAPEGLAARTLAKYELLAAAVR